MLSSDLLDESERPHIRHWNEDYSREVKSELEEISKLTIAPDIEPVLGKANIHPAQKEINEIYKEVRKANWRAQGK